MFSPGRAGAAYRGEHVLPSLKIDKRHLGRSLQIEQQTEETLKMLVPLAVSAVIERMRCSYRKLRRKPSEWRVWSEEVPRVQYVEIKRPHWNVPIGLDLERDEPEDPTIGVLLWREWNPHIDERARRSDRKLSKRPSEWRVWSEEVPRVRYVEVKRPEWNYPMVLDLERDEPGALTIGVLLWREYNPHDDGRVTR